MFSFQGQEDTMIQCIVCEDWLHSQVKLDFIFLEKLESEIIFKACRSSDADGRKRR